jgi:5'-nucleotidase/UDP-sugar diphosphatase
MSRILSKAAIAAIILSIAIAMPVFALQSAGSAESSSPAAKANPVYTVPKAVPPVEPQAPAIAPSDVVTITILHTNDFHGNLESDYQGRGGSAYIAGVVDQVRADKGADNVLLVDAGDIFFGAPPISQLLLGESAIDIYNLMGYDIAAFGNHEFDKGQTVLISRTTQSNFPWVGANIVLSGTTWEHPTWVKPYVTMTVGSPNSVTLGIIGLDTDETPLVTLKGTTDGLVFEDLTDAVLHYYDEVMAQADALIVLVHMGTEDSGPYKGLATVARELVDAGKPVDLMIGGHQHEYMPTPTVISDTTIIEAYQYGRVLGDAEVAIDTTAKSLSVLTYTYHTINNTLTANTVISDRVAYWASKVVTQVQKVVGSSYISLTRDYSNESIMGDLVADSMLWKADDYDDDVINGSVDIAFTNPGGLRADIEAPTDTLPYTITWGDTFNVLPFANTLFYMDLTGAQIETLLNQSAKLFKGILQSSGITWSWYNDDAGAYNPDPTVWGAFDIQVGGQPLSSTQVYRVVTNNFLAPGGDGWVTFAEGTNRWDSYYDMQEGLNEYISTTISPIEASDIVTGRITFAQPPTNLSTSRKSVMDESGDGMAEAGEILTYTIMITNTGTEGAGFILTDTLPTGLTYVDGSLSLSSAPVNFTATVTNGVLMAHTAGYLTPPAGGSLYMPNAMSITFAVQVTDPVPEGESISNAFELIDQNLTYILPAVVIPIKAEQMVFLPLILKNATGTLVTP